MAKPKATVLSYVTFDMSLTIAAFKVWIKRILAAAVQRLFVSYTKTCLNECLPLSLFSAGMSEQTPSTPGGTENLISRAGETQTDHYFP